MEEKSKIYNLGSIPQNAAIQKEQIMEGELTGYPSIDKPWLKYYSKDIIDSKLPSKTIYRYIYDNNEKYLDRTALNYYGNKITYRSMFENIEKAAQALLGMGVKKGDIVTISMPTIPEAVYLFYALSKIGAIANMIDPRKSEEEIVEYINEVNSTKLFAISAISSKLCNIKDKTNVDYIVEVSPAESLPIFLNYAMGLKQFVNGIFANDKNKQKNKESLNWKEFLDFSKRCNFETEIEYEENRPVVIVYTGGTTGTSKGVMLSNDNINAASYQCENCGFDFQKQHKWLNIMPPFIAYGVGNGLHLPLACGMEVTLIPQFNPKEFDKLLLKHKPNHMTGVPTHYDGILNSKILKNKNLNFIYSAIVGGDKLAETSEVKINQYLDEHNCNYKIAKGYGLSEVCAAVCVTSKNKINEVGSVGIPFSHTVISIFDFETGEELKYGEIGEVCITGPNTMLRYYNNDEETRKLLRLHNDEKIWVHSGDIGYMNEDGNIFIIGRNKEMIIRHDGFKVYPLLIEKVVMLNPEVDNCKVVGIPDKNYSQGELPKVYITLKDSSKYDDQCFKNKIINDIKILCEKNLAEYLIPVEYEIKQELPKTSIGKIDFMSLKKENAKQYIKK